MSAYGGGEHVTSLSQEGSMLVELNTRMLVELNTVNGFTSLDSSKPHRLEHGYYLSTTF